MSRVFVVIPAYREGTVIHAVVRNVIESGVATRVVVVDDASPDDTAIQARNAGAVVVRHPINLGQGAALQTGFARALQEGADVVVTFDADGQHRVEDARRLVDALLATGADIALGSRFMGATIGMPVARRFLLVLATAFTRLTTGLRVTDAHNGIRAISRRALERIDLTQNRMAHASELLEIVASRSLKYIEVPVTIEYTAYSKAKGQRALGALTILYDLVASRFIR